MSEDHKPARDRLVPAGIGLIQLYRSRDVLERDLSRCRRAGFAIRILDSGDWGDGERLHDDLARSLDFPPYYGRNLDALSDCLRGLASDRHRWPAEATGCVLVLQRFDRFAVDDRRLAAQILEILVEASVHGLLYGWPLLTMVQSDDPALRVDPVAPTPIDWNSAERSGWERI